eukprot:g4729.t1
MDPDVLLLDEPLSALDALTRANLQDEIEAIWEADRKTVILITNDVDEAILLADRIIPLTPGPSATLGPSFEVNLPRPRDRTAVNSNPVFKALRAEVTGYLLDASEAEREARKSAERAAPDLKPTARIEKTPPRAYLDAARTKNENRFVELFELKKIYPTPKGPLTVLEDFNLKMDKGQFVSLIGHSGCGKSTVLSMVAGLNEISGGGVVLDNHEISGAGPDRAVVFQAPSLMPWLTARENVALGVDRVYPKASAAERREVVEYYLERVGLGDSMHKQAAELSNGMKQRVGIARAFALSPKLLLLDEPFGMLDSLTRWELQEVLMDVWKRTQVTAICVTHDVDEAILLVIVGNGMAPGRMLEELFKLAPNTYDVTIFNAEPRVNYDRIMLSPVLSGERTYDDIIIHDDAWYADNHVTLHKGRKVTSIDRQARSVTAEDGTVAPYDKLVLATGSAPFIIPVPGKDLDGVLGYRDLDDVNQMLGTANQTKSAVVIGGGLLGLEAAAGLQVQGMEVTVVHLMPTLMERQLDAAAGHLLRRSLEERGIRIITEANTKEILGTDGKARAVLLDDGTELAADLVVMAVGIRPNASLAADCKIETDRGIVVDDCLATNDPDVFALGECAQHRGVCYGLVAPLYEMAKTLANGLAGEEATYTGSLTSTKLKVTGINLFSAGDFAEGEEREEVVLRDAQAGVYRRLVLEDNKLIGAVLYGDVTDGAWFFDLIKNGTDISDMRDTLIFGQAFAGSAPLDPMVAVAALPDDAEICGCNGVCKGTILEEIGAQHLSDVEGVRAHTKASASCGSCTGLVEQLLTLSLGDAFNPAAIQPMCGCTDLGHGDVRRLIVAKELKSLEDVMQELEWKTSCGCAKCRPALNYYLLATWPGEYVDDAQSRFVNERVHANIQKDGTYSVVPRMWGGITSADELRAIADVADKFSVPTVKVTGGQRIDLLGIKKEDLPEVWSDLNQAGLVSGHAYGKALRTVKTCVGTDWPDWWIITEVAGRMGFPGFSYESPAEIFREHAALSAFENDGTRDFDLSGLMDLNEEAYEDLSPVQWPFVAGAEVGTNRLFGQGAFYTKTGKANFVAVSQKTPATETNATYPLVLNSGRIRDQWHTMTRTGQSARLSSHIAEPFVEMHPDDALSFGIEIGDVVRVTSATGSVLVRASVTPRQSKGSVFVPIHWTAPYSSCAEVDVLVGSHTDPISGQPELKFTPVRVERAPMQWHAFLVSVPKPDLTAFPYWALARTKCGWRAEIAGDGPIASFAESVKDLIDDGEPTEAETFSYDNGLGGGSHMQCNSGKLDHAVFWSAKPVEVARAWLVDQLGREQDPASRYALLAGRAGAGQPDKGAIVCSCFEVGANQITQAMREGADTVDAVGVVVNAGTNCGSCRSEIGRLLVTADIREAV